MLELGSDANDWAPVSTTFWLEGMSTTKACTSEKSMKSFARSTASLKSFALIFVPDAGR